MSPRVSDFFTFLHSKTAILKIGQLYLRIKVWINILFIHIHIWHLYISYLYPCHTIATFHIRHPYSLYHYPYIICMHSTYCICIKVFFDFNFWVGVAKSSVLFSYFLFAGGGSVSAGNFWCLFSGDRAISLICCTSTIQANETNVKTVCNRIVWCSKNYTPNPMQLEDLIMVNKSLNIITRDTLICAKFTSRIVAQFSFTQNWQFHTKSLKMAVSISGTKAVNE